MLDILATDLGLSDSAWSQAPRGCLQAGDVVGRNYEILSYLAEGANAVVYLCRHRLIPEQLFALKVFFYNQSQPEGEQSSQRFENEARLCLTINHPHVVSGFAFFKEQAYAALLLEYVDGGTLADLIHSQQKLRIKEVLRLLTELGAGIEAIHRAGIVHRDLKPENILITKEGLVKVADFGICRSSAQKGLTAHGGLLGTMDYLSPEYLMNGELDERSDLYTLGLLGYELLTGQKPFSGETLIEALKSKLNGKAEAPNELRADCPDDLSMIIMKAFARNPAERYQRAADFIADLSQVRIKQKINLERLRIADERRILARRPLVTERVECLPAPAPVKTGRVALKTLFKLLKSSSRPRTAIGEFISFSFFFALFLFIFSR